MRQTSERLVLLAAYSLLSIALIALTSVYARIYGHALSGKKLFKLRVQVFEICMFEIYSYYFTASSIRHGSRRNEYMHLFIYLYGLAKVAFVLCSCEMTGLLVVNVVLSSAKVAFVFFCIIDCSPVPADSEPEVMDLARFLLAKIVDLRHSFRCALYFFSLKDCYLLLAGRCPPHFVPVLVLIVLGDYFSAVRGIAGRLRHALELLVLAIASVLEMKVLLATRNQLCTITTVFRCILLAASALLLVVKNNAERLGLHSLVENHRRRQRRWKKLQG